MRSQESYATLKKIPEENPGDIWVLQEIQDKVALHRVFPHQRYILECENRMGQHRVCIAIKRGKGLQFRRHPDLVSLRLKKRGLRAGMDFTILKQGKAIRVLGIHLKSGCFNEKFEKSKRKICTTLRRQTHYLEKWIDARSLEGIPYLVIGDFNRHLTKKRDAIWKEIDDGEPINSDLVNLNASQKNTCWDSKYRYFVDFLIADKRAAKHYIPGSFKVASLSSYNQGPESLSDHCPILASFAF